MLCYNIWVKVYIFKLFTKKKKNAHIAKLYLKIKRLM